MSEAAQEMYQLNEDELIREQCRARDMYQRRIQELEAQLANK